MKLKKLWLNKNSLFVINYHKQHYIILYNAVCFMMCFHLKAIYLTVKSYDVPTQKTIESLFFRLQRISSFSKLKTNGYSK